MNCSKTLESRVHCCKPRRTHGIIGLDVSIDDYARQDRQAGIEDAAHDTVVITQRNEVAKRDSVHTTTGKGESPAETYTSLSPGKRFRRLRRFASTPQSNSLPVASSVRRRAPIWTTSRHPRPAVILS